MTLLKRGCGLLLAFALGFAVALPLVARPSLLGPVCSRTGATGAFASPADEPFLETLTLLGYLAASTRTIKLGSTVIIVPYRNPVVQAKMLASLDVLSHGRLICGVGVGWLEKEFETLGVPYAARGAMTDEWLDIFKILWTERDPEYHGTYYRFSGIQFWNPFSDQTIRAHFFHSARRRASR